MDKKGTQIYEFSTLGLPPLRMVLVHAQNEAQNAADGQPVPETLLGLTPLTAQPADGELDREVAVRKIIQHLKALDG